MALTMRGLLGQEHLVNENKVWITETHFPHQTSANISFCANKMFCIVRNPLDVMPSHAQFINMKSHWLTSREKLNEDFAEWWAEFAKESAIKIQFNHDYIVNNLSKSIPTFILRYEDLLSDPETTLTDCFRFLLDAPSIEDTIVEKRIKEIVGQGLKLRNEEE